MKYAIIGTGAIGGYYGAKLAKAGNEVHFLLHNDYNFVCQNGLQVNSCNGSFHLNQVNAYNNTADMPPVDVVIVGLKTTNNYLLKDMLPPLLQEHTILLLIQNGLGVEEDVQQLFPHVQLVAGLAFICSAKNKPGTVDHQCYGSINLGNYSCHDEKRFQQLMQDLEQAEVPVHNYEYHEARWRKAVWNMPFNGMTVAMNTLTNHLLALPQMREIIHSQMLEVIHAAWACGVTGIQEDFADKMIDMTLSMVPYAPSMKLDYDYHRAMEIKYLYSRPIEIARAHGFCMPQLEMLEAQLLFIEQQQMAKKV